MGWRGRGGGGGWSGPWPGRGPFNHLPPWQRPGWLFGGGFGRGLGFGGGGYPYNPGVCARFPWLPRWWWARPGYGYGQSYPAYGPGYGAGYGYPYMTYPRGAYGAPGYGYPYAAYPSYPQAPYMGYW